MKEERISLLLLFMVAAINLFAKGAGRQTGTGAAFELFQRKSIAGN